VRNLPDNASYEGLMERAAVEVNSGPAAVLVRMPQLWEWDDDLHFDVSERDVLDRQLAICAPTAQPSHY
jgi:hypothetical protein